MYVTFFKLNYKINDVYYFSNIFFSFGKKLNKYSDIAIIFNLVMCTVSRRRPGLYFSKKSFLFSYISILYYPFIAETYISKLKCIRFW